MLVRLEIEAHVEAPSVEEGLEQLREHCNKTSRPHPALLQLNPYLPEEGRVTSYFVIDGSGCCGGCEYHTSEQVGRFEDWLRAQGYECSYLCDGVGDDAVKTTELVKRYLAAKPDQKKYKKDLLEYAGQVEEIGKPRDCDVPMSKEECAAKYPPSTSNPA